MKSGFSFLIIVLFISLLSSCNNAAEELKEDETEAAARKIYWSAGDAPDVQIKKASIDNTADAVVIVDNLNYIPAEIKLDTQRNKIYWLNENTGNQIIRANSDGTGSAAILTNTWQIADFCIDTVNGKIYWTEWETKKIIKANLDCSNPADLTSDALHSFNKIAVDIDEGKIYWTMSMGFNRINTDGSNPEHFYSGDVQHDFALDLINNKIYYSPNLAVNGFSCIDFNGTVNPDIIIGALPNSDIAIDSVNGKIYYTGLVSGIKKCDLNGSNIVTVIADPAHSFAIE